MVKSENKRVRPANFLSMYLCKPASWLCDDKYRRIESTLMITTLIELFSWLVDSVKAVSI